MEELTLADAESKSLSYRTMTIEYVIDTFHLLFKEARLFQQVTPVQPAAWLIEVLQRSKRLSLVSEKARSEFIVAPILLNFREIAADVNIYSGTTFDVDPAQGLKGVCDFIISKSEPFPVVKAPVIMMVEAKKNDLDEALGQCAAEMVAARIFNQRHNSTIETIYGCITTGELWQFLKLADNTLTVDEERIYIEKVDLILGMLKTIIDDFQP